MATTYQYEGRTVTHDELRQMFPTVSFPENPKPNDLVRLGVSIVEERRSGSADLEEARSQKLALLSERFASALSTAHFVSPSAGFEVDATEAARASVESLIRTMEHSGRATTQFMDHTNVMRNIALEKLRMVLLEISVHIQNLYARKWKLRTEIDNAPLASALAKIDVSFDNIGIPKI